MTTTHTHEIMSQIKSYERRSIVTYFIIRIIIIAVSLAVSVLTAQAAYTFFAEQGRFEFLELISVDTQMLRMFLAGEIVSIIADLSVAERITIAAGLLIGSWVAYRLIRALPVLTRKWSALRRI